MGRNNIFKNNKRTNTGASPLDQLANTIMNQVEDALATSEFRESGQAVVEALGCQFSVTTESNQVTLGDSQVQLDRIVLKAITEGLSTSEKLTRMSIADSLSRALNDRIVKNDPDVMKYMMSEAGKHVMANIPEKFDLSALMQMRELFMKPAAKIEGLASMSATEWFGITIKQDPLSIVGIPIVQKLINSAITGSGSTSATDLSSFAKSLLGGK